MAVAADRVVVEVIAHDHGHWCNTCQLPSGVRAWVTTRCAHVMRIHVTVWCEDCDGRDVTVDAPPA